MADRKISDLTALTTPASGDYLPIVDISEAAASDKNKRITIEELMRGVPDGTVGAPGIAFESDPNTGIYSPGDDQVAVSTNGAGRLFIDASGNIGAGYSTPGNFAGGDLGATRPLVVGDGTASTNVNIFSDSTGYGHLAFSDGTSGTSTYAGLIQYYHTTDSMALYTAATVRLLITSTGQLSHIGGGSTGSPAVGFNGSAPSNSLVVDSTGKVGIGTASPGEKLDVYAGSLSVGSVYVSTLNTDYKIRLRSVGAATNNNYLVEIGASGSGPQPSDSDLTLATQTWNGSAYVTTEKARLTATGRLGIGTTSPNSVLQVNSGTNLGGILVGFNAGSSNFYDADLQVFRTGNGTERARIDSSGRLLVGTASALTATNAQYSKFIVQGASSGSAFDGRMSLSRGTAASSLTSGNTVGSIYFTDINSNEFAAITAAVDGTTGASDAPGRLVFSTTADGASSPTERMRITSTGQLRLAGAGITFNGDTAAANELDDYEEGTWTPDLAGSTTAGTYETTFASGWYTKIGRQVTVQFRINLAGSITGGGSGFAVITGLPFNTSTDNYANGGSVLLDGVNFNDTATCLYLYKRSTTSAQLVISEVFDNAAAQDVGIADFAASSIIAGSLIYFIS